MRWPRGRTYLGDFHCDGDRKSTCLNSPPFSYTTLFRSRSSRRQRLLFFCHTYARTPETKAFLLAEVRKTLEIPAKCRPHPWSHKCTTTNDFRCVGPGGGPI